MNVHADAVIRYWNKCRKAGYITRAECDSLKALPLVLHFTRMHHKEIPGPYFREYLRILMTRPKPDRSTYRGWQKQQFYEDSLAWETNPLWLKQQE